MTGLALTAHIDPDRFPLSDKAGALDRAALIDAAPSLEAAFSDADLAHFLDYVASCSPFLAGLMRRDADFLAHILSDGPDAAVETALADMAVGAADESQPAIMKRLRTGKRHAALAIALADISGGWSLDWVTDTLSRVADRALNAAAAFAVRELARTGSATGVDPADPNAGSGYTIIGMGKLGARELNYSSDIDIVVLYDPERLKPADPDRLRQDAVRATRTLMRLMDERTVDGYVFRTDLRLRPDPSATPLAVSVRAAETYYESLGQNWERAAMIKARAVAGDIELGEEFLHHIRPFVWRKFLDFAAIQDIHSIKRQINAHRGGSKIAVDGHNVKIGRGGIREVEFYAQTQQLIWGGREPDLRERRTCNALDGLAHHGHAEPETVAVLKEAYAFLRTLEHRLQMVNDSQTQKLPDTGEGMADIARFMGFDDVREFRAAVRRRLEDVEGHYARLFEESPDLGGGGSLVFTGTDDDPDTADTLAKMGFKDVARVAERIRIWHRGRYRATRSERSRQILTELMPRLLQTLADTADPDEAFVRFDAFLDGLPAGVQLFSLFHAHPQLLDLLAEILGSAPRLAAWLSRKPVLLDSVLDPDFYDPDEPASEMHDSLAYALKQANDYQDVLDIVRRWTNDHKFQSGVQLLRNITDGDRLGPTLSAVADCALSQLAPSVEAEFAEQHGRFDAGGLAVVAFGKLGGRELLPMSDLDLVFVYDAGGQEASDGPKPLGPQVYFLRLAQRLVTAISSETGEGRLYEVDNRLRPDGKAGPLATQLQTLESYYRIPDGDAWTWEHMALTRARPVCGPDALCRRLEDCFHEALTQKRDLAALSENVVTMRARIARELPAKGPWDIKFRSGGLVDLEFAVQYLQLRHGADTPGVLGRNTATALENLKSEGILDDAAYADLREGLALWRRLQAMIRLTAVGRFDVESAPAGQVRALARACDRADISELTPMIEDAAQAVRARYEAILGG